MTSQPPRTTIEVSNLTVRYPNGVIAVRETSFALQGGTITALVGINGSGKSTLFKTIMGFLKPVEGRSHSMAARCRMA